jgi:hypothetical protein
MPSPRSIGRLAHSATWVSSVTDQHDERTLVSRAGGDGIERPGIVLARILLQLGFDDHTENRIALDEQYRRVGVILDRRDLVERRIGDPRLGEPRDADVQHPGQ